MGSQCQVQYGHQVGGSSTASVGSGNAQCKIRAVGFVRELRPAGMTEQPLLSVAQVAGELGIPPAHVRVLMRRHPEACTRISKRVVYARRDRLADLLEDDGRHDEPKRQAWQANPPSRPRLGRRVDGQIPRAPLALAGQLRRRDRHATTTPDRGISDKERGGKGRDEAASGPRRAAGVGRLVARDRYDRD